MRLFLIALLAFSIAACNETQSESQEQSATEQVVNVYSHRHYEVDQVIFNRFESETGIRVNVVKAGADELITRLENEGAKSPADLLVTVDAGRLVLAKTKNLLQAVSSPKLEQNIPSYLRDSENYWFGQTVRARMLVYAKDRVKPDDLSTYEALTSEKWKGRILVRSSDNIYNQSLLSSMVAHGGDEAAENWARGIVNNLARKPKGNDRDQVIAIASGLGDVAIVNSYYLGKLIQSDEPGERAAVENIGIFFPNQNDRGTHINISGAGVTAHAPNRENAVKLLEFLSRDDIQELFAEANSEYPVKPGVPVSELLQSWGEFKQDTMNLSLLGIHNSRAVEIFDRVGWK
ncbi:MAG: Fe(3+) ABC transporter substrate-binding protein [Cryomorphaceae bacterium]|nr:MAG: Fe(3+) ABC transporter substrate-binding protein [Cryomorphaceae bacterium]